MFEGAVSPIHIAIVAIVALVVLGPDKMPDAARSAARLWREFQTFRSGLSDHVHGLVDDVIPPEVRTGNRMSSPTTPPAGDQQKTGLSSAEHEGR